MRLRLILALLLLAPPAWAASPVGLWWTEDHSGVIQIEPCGPSPGQSQGQNQGQGLCGRIVGQPHPRNADGSLPLDAHGVPLCGLTILHDAEPTGKDGHYRGVIVNPEDASNWNCEMWVDADGALRLRGYVLIPLLGETQTWTAFHGTVAADCAIS